MEFCTGSILGAAPLVYDRSGLTAVLEQAGVKHQGGNLRAASPHGF
ncbi:hypothetical protein [Leisingera aquimarina]|nr:hypothetical protein [Leisingera aquimarina]